MNSFVDFEKLFDSMYPDFFKQDYLKDFPEDKFCEEMIMNLKDFDSAAYTKSFPENVSFGFYKGTVEELQKAVAKVDEGWVQYFNKTDRVFCGFIDGNITSFCLLDDMGTHKLGETEVKVGGPGCVGTIPEFRNRGIGLVMVKKGTEILKSEGYDISFIHYTGVAPWYAKLGYQTILKWNKNGLQSY